MGYFLVSKFPIWVRLWGEHTFGVFNAVCDDYTRDVGRKNAQQQQEIDPTFEILKKSKKHGLAPVEKNREIGQPYLSIVSRLAWGYFN
ncbi:MAG TPA: hypothetical protein VEY70_25585 [Metabacillus sp.]|nr:hypothetical protein [Metabacillus sp.]